MVISQLLHFPVRQTRARPLTVTGRQTRQTRRGQAITVRSTGAPTAVSSLAKLLLARQQRPRLELVTDDQSRSLLPEIEQGPQRRLD